MFVPEQNQWFAAEILPHDAALRRYLYARFPAVRPADVDDLVQECYSRLLRAHRTGPVASPKAFLLITARNLALNHLRHLSYEKGEPLAEPDGSGVFAEGANAPESAARSEELQILIQAIQSLPARCREVLTLRKIKGLSQREISERLGISENTVEKQTAIGLRKCVEYFHRQGHPDRR